LRINLPCGAALHAHAAGAALGFASLGNDRRIFRQLHLIDRLPNATRKPSPAALTF